MIFIVFWSVRPTYTKTNTSTTNYIVDVTGGVMILSAVWYFVRAREVYKEPTIDEEVAAVMRVRFTQP